MLSNAYKNIMTTVSIIFLFLAVIGNWQYDFYTLLRIVVFSTSAFIAWLAYKNKKMDWALGYLFIAVFFNPIVPIHLNRELWIVIDLLVVLFLITSLFNFKITEHKKQNGDMIMNILLRILEYGGIFGYAGNTFLIMYIYWTCMSENLFQIINPFLHFSVIFKLLTTPLFWIFLVITILGQTASQKRETN